MSPEAISSETVQSTVLGSVTLWAGVLSGGLLLASVAWVWLKKQHFGLGGSIMTLAGIVLIGLAAFRTVSFGVGDTVFEAVLLAEVQKTRSAVLESQGKSQESEQALRSAAALVPEDPEVFQALGSSLARQGRFEEAEGAFQQALALAPDQVTPRLDLAAVLAKRGEPEQAIELVQGVQVSEIKNPKDQARFGTLLLDLGDVERARSVLTEAAAMNPDEPTLHFGLASVLREAGDLEASKREALQGHQLYLERKDLLQSQYDFEAAGQVAAEAAVAGEGVKEN